MSLDIYNKQEVQSLFKCLYFLNAMLDFGPGNSQFWINTTLVSLEHRSSKYQTPEAEIVMVDSISSTRKVINVTDATKKEKNSVQSALYFDESVGIVCTSNRSGKFRYSAGNTDLISMFDLTLDKNDLDEKSFLYELHTSTNTLPAYLLSSLVHTNYSTFSNECFIYVNLSDLGFTSTELWDSIVKHFSTYTRYRSLVREIQEKDEIV